MKQTTIGVFNVRADAEKAVNRVHNDLSIPADDISYLYRTKEGELREIDGSVLRPRMPSAGASALNGAFLGLILGALIGVAGAIGAAPIVADLLAGPLSGFTALATALGLGGAGLMIGISALLGAILGALVGLAVHFVRFGASPRENLKHVEDRDRASEILVAVSAPDKVNVISVLRSLGALDARVYRLSI